MRVVVTYSHGLTSIRIFHGLIQRNIRRVWKQLRRREQMEQVEQVKQKEKVDVWKNHNLQIN